MPNEILCKYIIQYSPSNFTDNITLLENPFISYFLFVTVRDSELGYIPDLKNSV